MVFIRFHKELEPLKELEPVQESIQELEPVQESIQELEPVQESIQELEPVQESIQVQRQCVQDTVHSAHIIVTAIMAYTVS